jgi:hypothetical protein
MTLNEALESNLKIAPGRRVKTFGGWCRNDKVLLDGIEIGRIQTRRAKNRTESITLAGNVYIIGYDVEWLISQGRGVQRRGAMTA